jgi:hypothetical protein
VTDQPYNLVPSAADELNRSLRRHPANGHDAATRALIDLADQLATLSGDLDGETAGTLFGCRIGLEHARSLVETKLTELGVDRG